MKFRLISDLHLDFSEFKLPEMEDDSDSYLIIAGDMCEGTHFNLFYNFLEDVSYRFRKVFFVLGNHDYYGRNFYTFGERVKSVIYDEFMNVVFLDNSTHIERDVAIIGCPLWTNFDNENPRLLTGVSRAMADYMWIKKSSGNKISPLDILEEHKRSVRYLIAAIEQTRNDGKEIIVVTHHAPSWKSVTPRFQGDILNGAFVSDLSEMILDKKPDIWCHGHVHSCHDYMIGDTRILCNSRGYHSDRNGISEQTGFNSLFNFELGAI